VGFGAAVRDAYPCDFLLCTLGIDFNHEAERRHSSLDTADLRNCDRYRFRKEEALPYFTNWKQAAKPEAVLLTVLRVTDIDASLALVDAAHETGWALDIANSAHLQVDGERFAVFNFSGGRAAAPPEQDEILSWWAAQDIASTFDETYHDPFAIVLFQALAEKVILKTEVKTYPDGHTMRKVIGKAGPLGFLFSRATTGRAELKLVPLAQLPSLKITFDQ
jgi:hypothetical protein